MKYIKEFFATHPTINEVFEAPDGNMFLTDEYAKTYMSNKEGEATRHTREEVEALIAKEKELDNSGAGGSTEQQPNGTDTITEGTENGLAASPSATNTETDQNTETGNVIDFKERSVEEIEQLISEQQKVVETKTAALKKIKNAQEKSAAEQDLEVETNKLEGMLAALEFRRQQQ